MKFLLLLAASVASAAAAATPYLARMADSFLRRGVTKDFHYAEATLYLGFEAAYELTKNETLYSWYHNQIDGIVLDDGTIDDWNYTFYSLDEYVSPFSVTRILGEPKIHTVKTHGLWAQVLRIVPFHQT
jgi:hypothetical protein